MENKEEKYEQGECSRKKIDRVHSDQNDRAAISYKLIAGSNAFDARGDLQRPVGPYAG